MYEDKTLVCKECGQEFVFTAGEQEFYAERGFQNEPQRCKACRDARKNAARGPREYFTAVCAASGFGRRLFARFLGFRQGREPPVFSRIWPDFKKFLGISIEFTPIIQYNDSVKFSLGGNLL